MNKEYTEKELKNLIDFTLKNNKYKTNTILKKWKKGKSSYLSKEEKSALKDYEIAEIPLISGTTYLSIQNMPGVHTPQIETIMQKYGTYNYYTFFDDNYGLYWRNEILVELSNINFSDIDAYDNDKYMKIYKNGPIIILQGPDYPWNSDNGDENDYYDKYSFEDLIPKFNEEGYSSYFDTTFEISTFFRLLVKVDDLKYTPAVKFLENKIKNGK